MFCQRCGNQVPDGSRFCVNCGAPLPEGNFSGVNQGNVNMQPGGYAGRNMPGAAPGAYGSAPTLSMSWYKFMVTFALWAAALIDLYQGVMHISGLIYSISSGFQVSPGLVYSFYGIGLRVVDVCYGLLMLALAGMCVYTRFQLAAYRRRGPACLVLLYLINIIAAVVYLLAAWLVGGIRGTVNARSVSSLMATIAFLVINYIYFSKRRHLFVN